LHTLFFWSYFTLQLSLKLQKLTTMMQTELLQKDLKTVGEEISYQLGAQMVKDYQVANPNDVKSYYIGRNIIDQILAQPGVVGLRFYNAYNEEGKKTLVYVGV